MLNLTRLHLGIAHESQFQGLGISARYTLEEAARTFLERIMGVRTGSGLTS
jgi:hypothetical protein